MQKLVIASRESVLAMWQAKHIQSRLQQLYPHIEVSILGMTTQGDQILDKTLSKIGGAKQAGSFNIPGLVFGILGSIVLLFLVGLIL